MSPVLDNREGTVEKVVRKIHELGPIGGAVRHVLLQRMGSLTHIEGDIL